MNKARAVFALGLVGLVGSALAQTPAEKPMTEQELLKKMDSIGTPAKQAPRLGLSGTGLDEKKRPPAPPKEKGETTIVAQALTFDQKSHEAVFTGKVVVTDPEFNVECDRLDAFLKPDKDKSADGHAAPADPPAKNPGPKGTPPKNPAPANPSPAAKAGEGEKGQGDKGEGDKKQDKGGALDHAIADADPGKTVLITQDKVEADGSISKNVGKGRRATYDAKTGDVVLTGNPSVQQGINVCVATDDTTVMTLNRDGRMKVDGPHKMIIKDSATIDGK